MLSVRSTRCRISATSRTSSLSWMRTGVTSARRARRSRLRTVHFAHDGRGRAAGFLIGGGASQKLRLHPNGGQRIVHLVGHTTRDLADRGQLLARDQLALRPELVGAVVERDEQVVRAKTAQIGDGAIADAALPPPQVLRDEHAPVPWFPLLTAGEHQPHRESARRQAELLEVPAHGGFLGLDAKHVDRRFIDLPYRAGGIDERHR